MTPVIQAGQAMVANVAFLKPAFHSSEKDWSLPDRPASIMSIVLSHACLTAGLVSTTSLSSVSK